MSGEHTATCSCERAPFDASHADFPWYPAAQVRDLTASGSTTLSTLLLFGCRRLSAEAVRAVLREASDALRTLDINGTLTGAELSEADIRNLCPRLTKLDARGRALKH